MAWSNTQQNSCQPAQIPQGQRRFETARIGHENTGGMPRTGCWVPKLLFFLCSILTIMNRYWSGAELTLEPRLSTKWITNIALFGNVISLPIPTPTFYLSNQLYNPTPSPLSTILENILPSINSKKNLSKGLQSSSGLVQHRTALALSKCLMKFQRVMEKFRDIALVLGEDDDGQWSKRCAEVKTDGRGFPNSWLWPPLVTRHL